MTCHRCTFTRITKKGRIKNKYAEKQAFKCRDYGRRFITDDGFKYMTNPKEIVVKALRLYTEGLSLSPGSDL